MIYRLSIYTGADGHEGYQFFKSIKDALAYARSVAPDYPINPEGYPINRVDIERLNTPKNKKDVLRMLNAWACHPDNG
jgi:hypothetical protein